MSASLLSIIWFPSSPAPQRAEYRHIVFMPENTNTVVHFRLGGKALNTIELGAIKLVR